MLLHDHSPILIFFSTANLAIEISCTIGIPQLKIMRSVAMASERPVLLWSPKWPPTIVKRRYELLKEFNLESSVQMK